ADDAFQTTFAVLVRKASSVMPRELIGNWLYGVASRTALKMRGARKRRQVKERQAAKFPYLVLAASDDSRELRPLLDQELNRLPAKYRVPVVLCYLEGKTRQTVARQ